MTHTTPLQKLSNTSPGKIQRVRWIYGYWKVHLTWLSLKWHSGPAGFLWLLKKNTVLKKLRPQPPEGALQHSTHLFNGKKKSRFFSYKKQTFLQLSKGKTNIYNKCIYSNDRKLFYQEKRYKQLFNSVQRSKKGGVFFNDWTPPQKKSLFESWKLLALGTTPSLFIKSMQKRFICSRKRQITSKSLQTAASRLEK